MLFTQKKYSQTVLDKVDYHNVTGPCFNFHMNCKVKYDIEPTFQLTLLLYQCQLKCLQQVLLQCHTTCNQPAEITQEMEIYISRNIYLDSVKHLFETIPACVSQNVMHLCNIVANMTIFNFRLGYNFFTSNKH